MTALITAARNILAIDPGLNACGVATMTRGAGVVAKTIRPKGRGLLPRIEQILDALPAQPVPFGPHPWDLLVIELPQIYQRGKQEGDPNDLIKLAVLVGAITTRVDALKILLPLPAEWKKQVPKKIHHQRIRTRVPGLGRCSMDAMDAVGLCLYGVEYA